MNKLELIQSESENGRTGQNQTEEATVFKAGKELKERVDR